LRTWCALALVLTAVVALLASPLSAETSPTPSPCPPGSLVVNATGTYICAVEVEEFTPAFTSVSVVQEGSAATLRLVCLTVGGCEVDVEAYDYVGGTLGSLGTTAVVLEPGASATLNYTCSGVCVFGLEVNGVWLGYFTARAPAVPTVSGELTSLARESPLVLVVVGLLVVSIPLGWSLTRDLGVSGLALVATSLLIYTLTYSLTGSVQVAATISVVAALVGIVYTVVHGGGA